MPRGVGPCVLLGVTEQHGPRRHQGDEAILVERQAVGVLVELLERRIEPVRKAVIDLLDRLADGAAARRRAAAAGLVRDRQGDALVERGSEQGRNETVCDERHQHRGREVVHEGLIELLAGRQGRVGAARVARDDVGERPGSEEHLGDAEARDDEVGREPLARRGDQLERTARVRNDGEGQGESRALRSRRVLFGAWFPHGRRG